MQHEYPDHYATLGLDSGCSEEEIRKAYRILAKLHHPDVNQDNPDARERTQAIIDAYKVLSHAARRKAYDAEREEAQKLADLKNVRATIVDIKQDAHIGLQDLVRGITLTIQVHDPANANGMESYELSVPEETAPGARFRIGRDAPFENGYVIVRVKMRPDARFKARGSNLRCDLKINHRLATAGGSASVRGVTGNYLQIRIPANCARGEVVCVDGEGLPMARGGRGDLHVRIMYRPDVRITRSAASEKSASPPRRRLGS